MANAADGSEVRIHYRGTLENGEEFDNSRTRGETLDFKIGEGALLPGFEQAVIGMAAGESKTISLPPELAYGAHQEEAIQITPKTIFPEGFEFIVGAIIQGNTPEGAPVLVKVLSEEEDRVTLDFNHPLAGKTLSFEIEMVEIIS